MNYFHGMILSLLMLLVGQYNIPRRTGATAASGGGGCTAPTSIETSQWPVYGTGVTCVGGACTSGSSISLIPDTVGSLSLAGNTGSYAEPHWSPSIFGSLQAANYSNPSGMSLGTGIPTSVTSTSFWATLQVAGSGRGIVGGPNSALEWRISAGGVQQVLVSNVALIGSGSQVFTTGVSYTVAVTVNATTGAWAMYTMSGGVVTTDASGTAGAISFGANITDFGIANGHADGFTGNIVDAGYFNGIWNSTQLNQIAAWSQCHAGV
jgi:hypothetical protein